MNNLHISKEDEKNNKTLTNKINLHPEESMSTNFKNHINEINNKNETDNNSSLIEKNKELKFEDIKDNFVFEQNNSFRKNNYNDYLENKEKPLNTIHPNNICHDLKNTPLNRSDLNDKKSINITNNLNILYNESYSSVNSNNKLQNKNDIDIKNVEDINGSYFKHDSLSYSNDKNILNYSNKNDEIIITKNIEKPNESDSYKDEEHLQKNQRDYLEIKLNNKLDDAFFTHDFKQGKNITKKNYSLDLNMKYDNTNYKNTSLNNNSKNMSFYDCNSFSKLDDKINNQFLKCDLQETQNYHINNEKKVKSHKNVEDYQNIPSKEVYKNTMSNDNVNFEKNENLLLSNLNGLNRKIEEISNTTFNNSLNISSTINNDIDKTDNNNNNCSNIGNSYNNFDNDNIDSNNRNNDNSNNNGCINNLVINENDNCNMDYNFNEKTNFKDKYKICNSNILNDRKNLDKLNIKENDEKMTSLSLEKDSYNYFYDSSNNSLNTEINKFRYEKKNNIVDENKENNKDKNIFNNDYKGNSRFNSLHEYNINNSFKNKQIFSNDFNNSDSNIQYNKKNNYEELNGNNYSNKSIISDGSKNNSVIEGNGINIIPLDNNLLNENYINKNNIEEKLCENNTSEANKKEDILIRKKEDNFDKKCIKNNSMNNLTYYNDGNIDNNKIVNHEENREYGTNEKVNDKKIKELSNEIYSEEFKNNNTSNECNMRNTNFIKYVNIEDKKNILNISQNKENNSFHLYEFKNNCINRDNEQKDIKDNNNIFSEFRKSYELNNFKNNINTSGDKKNIDDINKYTYIQNSTEFNQKENSDKNISKDSNNIIYNYKNELNYTKFHHKKINHPNNIYEMEDMKNHTYQISHKNVYDNEIKRRNTENLHDNCINIKYDKDLEEMNKNKCKLNYNKLNETNFLNCKKNNEKNYSEFYKNCKDSGNYEDYNYMNNLDKHIFKNDVSQVKTNEYYDNEGKIKERYMEEKMQKEEENFDYYYEKTLEFLNEEFYSNNIDNLNDRDILEKTPFFKLVNFEKKLASERKRVLNYYNEDKKQIYSNNINKDKQFSHIFHNNEKYYDAKEILAYLLPYHTFYLDKICIEPYKEDENISKKLENDIKKIEEEIYKIKDSFYTFTNPSIAWSFNKMINRITNQLNKKRRIK
ncbi:conserved Plasmodium protein, unknown function [Plasmodium gallinaceum]|uniref:Uncharacterized protein n=1 Tax=Plasmodium gallinaceum TaxID=5849 RepID=A0A1J1GS12_PLAGA|nr:conserved Plasmodium protein, unknown function [Plasmodium gallinaceum]CRG95289.1 conserved Plasmodium protein, unknown function [Plasmodium gallinaceum]